MKKLCNECGGYAELTPQKLLEDISRVRAYYWDSRAILLPFKLREIEMTDIGPVRHFKAELGEINAISGGNMYGKSSVFTALGCMLSKPRPNYLITYERKRYSKRSEIRVGLEKPVEEIRVRMNRGDPFSDVRCVIVNEELFFDMGRLFEGLAAFCKKRGMQLIVFGLPRYASRVKRAGGKLIRLPGK